MKVDKTKWEKVRLGEICEFLSRGKSPKYDDNQPLFPVFAQKCNLKDGGMTLSNTRFIDPSTIEKWQDIYKLRDQDILINSTGTGTVGRVGIFRSNLLGKFPFIVPDSHITVVRLNKELFHARFVFYILRGHRIQKYFEDNLKGSTNQKELYVNTVKESLLYIPKLSEQKTIAAELDALQSVIDKLQEQLNDYDKLAQSIFHEMFGDVRNNDKRWDVVLLSDVCEKIFAGGDKPEGYTLSKNEINTIPIYSNGINNDGLYGFCKEAKVTDECVTVSGRGTIGYTVVHNTPFTPIVRLIVAIPKKNVNVRFLKCMLDNIDFNRTGNTIPQLTVPLFKKHRILLPPFPLQRQFAERVEAIEAQKALVRQQIADAQQLFDSRMQYYFE